MREGEGEGEREREKNPMRFRKDQKGKVELWLGSIKLDSGSRMERRERKG